MDNSDSSDSDPDDQVFTRSVCSSCRPTIPAINKIYVRIAKKEILACIDGGADVSLIHPSTLNYLGLTPNIKERNSLKGLNGNFITEYIISNLPVEIGGVTIPLTFNVAERSPYPVLLGRDYLVISDATTKWKSGQTSMNYRGQETTFETYDLGYIPKDDRWHFDIPIPSASRTSLSESNNETKEIYFFEKIYKIKTHKDWNMLKENATDLIFIIPKPRVLPNKEIYISENDPNDKSELEIGNAFNENEKLQLKEFLKTIIRNLFCENLEEMRRLNVPPMRIEVGTAKPIKCPTYRIPAQHLPALKKALEELLVNKFIIKKSSEWNAPLLMVKKKDNTWRLVADYRKLNEVAIKDAGEIPVIQDLLDRISGSKIFSAMDCRSGFLAMEHTYR